MTDDEMYALDADPQWRRVRVQASDYAYEGWLVSVFAKRNRKPRCVVEDSCGRLFIHNASQLTLA